MVIAHVQQIRSAEQGVISVHAHKVVLVLFFLWLIALSASAQEVPTTHALSLLYIGSQMPTATACVPRERFATLIIGVDAELLKAIHQLDILWRHVLVANANLFPA